MDLLVIADSGSGSTSSRLTDAIKRLELDSPLTTLEGIDSVRNDLNRFAGFSGIAFFCVRRVEADFLELLQRLRSKVATEAKLVVTASESDYGVILKAVRAGASDFLSDDNTLDEELANLIARVQLERRNEEAQGLIVTVVPCSDPSDADLLAVNLAVAFAKHADVCGLLDFHFRGGDLALLLKLDPRHTIIDLLSQHDTIDIAMLQQAVARHASGVELLAGPSAFADMWNIRLQECQEIVALAQQCWPVVVINSEDVQHPEQLSVLTVSDEIVLTMRPDIPSLQRTQQHVEFLEQIHISRSQLHVAVMRTGYPGELPLSALKKVLQVSNLHSIADDPVATIMSVNVGNPLIRELPKAKPSVAIKSLADSIMGAEDEQTHPVKRRTKDVARAAARLATYTLSVCGQ